MPGAAGVRHEPRQPRRSPQVVLGAAFIAMQRVLRELRDTGAVASITGEEFVRARQAIEDIIGLDEHYAIEEETVEHRP